MSGLAAPFLGPLAAFAPVKAIIGLPRWAKEAALGAAAVLAFLAWLHLIHDPGVRKAATDAANAKAAIAARKADERAGEAVRAAEGQVSRGNDAAKAAARANPGDPLKAGLDSLRDGRSSGSKGE